MGPVANRRPPERSPGIASKAVHVRPHEAARALETLYEPIREELEAFESILEQQLSSQHALVERLVKHGARLGGKRLRPALLLLSAKAVGPLRREHLVLAAVVEMIHTATLVHDDVLDEAVLRRHLDTVNARWGNQASVLLGDYLFTHSFYLASTLGDAFACQMIGQATNVVCEGELRQIGSQGNLGLSETEYIEIIEAKTAALCSCCCRLGAHYAGASPQVEQSLADYGRALGIAFQIADDLLDVVGDESTAGKSLGTDLEQLKPTLPLIRVLGQLAEPDRRELAVLLGRGGARREQLAPWLARSDALDYSRRVAARYAEEARGHLDGLPCGPLRTVLKQLTGFVVDRQR